MKNNWLRFSGILGLIIFLFGVLGMLIAGFGNYALFTLGHMAVGLVLMVSWFLTYGIKNLGSAGSVIKGRTTRFSANALLYSLIIGLIFIGGNWLVKRNDKRWDLTEEGVYSLSPYTTQLIQNLKEPLKLVAFKVTQDPESLKDTLNLYKSANPSKVTTELVDPRTKPHLVDSYGMKQGNVIYLQYGEGDKKAVSRIGETSEESLTNAIIKLTRSISRKVYFVQGHDEPSIKDTESKGLKQFADSVVNENMTVAPIILSTVNEIPKDASVVVLVAPKKNLMEQEKQLLINYVEAGGKLVMFGEPRTTSDVKDIAAKFNIKVGDDVVIDLVKTPFGTALGTQPIIQDYGTHPITKGFKEDDATIFNIASTVDPVGDVGQNGLTVLAKSSPTAWGETNVEALFNKEDPKAEKDASDINGPVNMAVSFEKKVEKPEDADKDKRTEAERFENNSRLVVFGDSDIILNYNLMNYANKDLSLNAVNWLSGEEGGISIRPKSMRKAENPMPAMTFTKLMGTSFVIPELLLLFGLFVWWRRNSVYE